MKLNEFWKGMTRNAPDQGGGSAPEPEGAEPTVAEEAAAPDYSWMPEDYRKDGTPDFDSFKGHYQELLAEQARRAEESTVPESYDFALPEGFDLGVELPEGVDIALDTENPLFGEFGTFLKERGISQEVATGLTGMLARYQAQQDAQQHAAATREYETLGATEAARSARVGSVQRALETKLPKDQAEALMGAVTSAAGVKALEAILRPRGGAAPAPAAKGADLEGLSGFDLLKRANELKMQA